MEFEIIPNEQTPKVPEIAFSDSKLFIEHHRKELDAFLEFAETQYTAVGLAANQCSLDGERFTMRVFALRNLFDHSWSLIIDPHITKEIGIKEMKAEGCLTWSGQKIVAERYRAVEVDYFDMDGKRHQGEIRKGFEGQIWQHEINHLNGVEEEVVPRSTPDPKPVDVGRNEPCPCGSGKKYKKCCLLLGGF
jgi:peptide deformylase